MWDMKPEAPLEIRGTFRPIETRVPGIQVCEHMPRMAQRRRQVHDRPLDEPRRGRAPEGRLLGDDRRPHATPGRPGVGDDSRGPAARRRGPQPVPETARGSIPPFVMIPEFISPVGVPRPGQHAGFLGAEDDPYLVNSDPNLPDYSPGELSLPIAPSAVATGESPVALAAGRRATGLPAERPRGTEPGVVLFPGVRHGALAGRRGAPSTSRSNRTPPATATAATSSASRSWWRGGWSRPACGWCRSTSSATTRARGARATTAIRARPTRPT